MPPVLVTRLFAAAAAFYRAAPWTISTRERPLYISRGGGHEWTAVIMGAAGNQAGLSCYHDPADLDRLADGGDDPSSALTAMQGTVTALLFNTRRELPRRMREEIKGARWDIAGPDAYPTLLVLNTPGGGIRQADFEFLTAALESVPPFAARHSHLFAEGGLGEGATWTDPDTGITCRLEPETMPFPDVLSTYDRLEPSGPEGPGATPLAMLDEDTTPQAIADSLSRFGGWLRDPTGQKPLAEATVERHVGNARLLVELCAYAGSRPLSAITEYDLRTFLYDWYPRKVADTERAARAMLVSLRRLFAFLRDHEGVECPWARPILADTEGFIERWRTCPRGFFWDPEVQAWQLTNTLELMARVLLPADDPDGGIEWGETMGVVEHALYSELQRLWLVWRDEMVRAGVVSPREVLAALFERQRVWAVTPHAKHAGRTPQKAIARERSSPSRR